MLREVNSRVGNGMLGEWAANLLPPSKGLSFPSAVWPPMDFWHFTALRSTLLHLDVWNHHRHSVPPCPKNRRGMCLRATMAAACVKLFLSYYCVLCAFRVTEWRIRVKTLNEKSDVKALAKEIIDKCKLIHPSKVLEVEQLLFYLQNRKDTTPGKGTAHNTLPLPVPFSVCYQNLWKISCR